VRPSTGPQDDRVKWSPSGHFKNSTQHGVHKAGPEPLPVDILVAALDAYESQQSWDAAEAADVAETEEQRTERQRAEAEVDGWMATGR
jgi:hypothetical protein